MAPLTDARGQAHSKIDIATLAVRELCLGIAVSGLGVVLVEAFDKERLVFVNVAKVPVGVRQLVAATGVNEQTPNMLEYIAGYLWFVVWEYVLDHGPLWCVSERVYRRLLTGPTADRLTNSFVYSSLSKPAGAFGLSPGRNSAKKSTH